MKKKKVSPVVTMGVVTVLIATLLSGCGSSGNESGNSSAAGNNAAKGDNSADSAKKDDGAAKAPVTVNFYVNNTFTADQKDAVTKALEEKTGVKLNIIQGNPDKLKVMLAAGEVYDLNLVESSNIDTVLKGNLAMPLDDLLSKHGQNIVKYAGKGLALYKKYKSNGQDKQFMLPIRTGDPNAVKAPNFQSEPTGLYLRTDYYKDLGYPAINNYDDLIGVLTNMQKAHPKTDDGKKVYGVSGWQDWGLWNFGIQFGFPAGMANIDNLHEQTAENTISNTYTDPNSIFWDAAKFYYKANKAGILDPDFFINKYDNYTAKYKAGQLLTVAPSWSIGEAYAAISAKGSKTASYAAVPMPDVWKYNTASLTTSYTSGGGFALFVGKNSKVADKVIDLLNYTFSPEGSRLIFSGVQGTSWDSVDGKPQPKQEFIDKKKSDDKFGDDTGIGLYEKLAGLDPAAIDPDDNGTYDLFNYSPSVYPARNNEGDKEFNAHFGIEYPGQLFTKYEQEGKLQPVNRIDDIRGSMPSAPNDIKAIDAAMETYMGKYIAKAVLAKNDADYEAKKKEIIDELLKMGGDKSNQWWTDTFNQTKTEVEAIIK